MKQKVYFDFDGTLYDSDKLTLEFLKICDKYGITKEEEQMAEKELFDEKYLFDLDAITRYLYEKYSLSEKIFEEVEELYFVPNLYSDALSALERLCKTQKYELIILTYGDIGHQKKKIENSNLQEYIDDVIITESSKANMKNIDYQNSIFIDNNPYQVEGFIKAGAKKVIRIRRPIDKYSKIDLDIVVKEYTNMVDLVDEELL